MSEHLFMKDIHGITVKVGDKIKGFGCIKFNDGWEVDLSQTVIVIERNGILFGGAITLTSFGLFKIIL